MILDGKKLKQTILNDLREEVSELIEKPKLVVIQVGHDEASNVYIKQKKNMCETVGYQYQHITLEETTTTEEILNIINKLNSDPRVNGILVQMPLPIQIDTNLIQNAVLPEKDVDGLTDINAGKLIHNKDALLPCTPYGVMELLKSYNISLEGKNVVIVGRSNLVGKPLAALMLNAGATVDVCHSKTIDLSKHTHTADILVSAVGKPKLITKEMVKEHAVIIDVGITRTANGLCGDVDYENVSPTASYITPVPGGVGPMTVAMLAKNILKAYKIQRMNNNILFTNYNLKIKKLNNHKKTEVK